MAGWILMATFQEIIDGAMAKSTKNQPSVIATQSVELRDQVNRILQGAYAFAAVVNPTRFSAQLTLPGNGGQWTRPEAAEAIIRLTDAVGADISVVPYDDVLANDPEPAVYEFGGVFRLSENQAAPPAPTASLTFWFARRPNLTTAPNDLTDTLDPVDIADPDSASQWPEAYNELLILELAMYLSRKDGRMDEVGGYVPDRDVWAQRFGSWLQRGTPIEQHRFSHKRVHNVETLIPMIGGGA
jgi:hypothetical protein